MKNNFELGALILRLVLGVSFLIHGMAKFQGGIGNTAGWFESIGLPGVFAYVVALIEVVGGLMLVAGLFTKVVSVVIAILMVGAIFTVKLGAGFLGDGQSAGYELDLAFLAMALALAFTGSKYLAVDQFIFKSKSIEG